MVERRPVGLRAAADGGSLRPIEGLVLALVAVGVAVLFPLLALLNRPIGTQVEMDGDLDESYCQMFPEDC